MSDDLAASARQRGGGTRHRLSAAAAALALLALCVLALRPETDERAPSAPSAAAAAAPLPRVDWWDWGINRVLTASERSQLDAMGARAVFILAGAIYQVGGEPTWTPQGKPGSATPGLDVHLVVRVDSELVKAIDARLAQSLVPMLLAGFARNRTPATVGLQLDCDVPTKRLPAYAGFLHDLRAQLPAGIQLSVTMLLDWARSPHLAELGREVDFVAPQFYNAQVPIDPTDTAASMSGDVAKVIARLEAAGVSYRLGLPTYEQCSVFNAKGDLQRSSVPLSPEAALAAGGAVRRVDLGDENTLEVEFAQATLAGGVALDAGSRLLFARLSDAGLAKQLAIVRRLAPPRCLGVCLFHLPGGEATRSLSIAQIAAAHAGTVRPAHISVRLEPHGGHRWTMIISNRGDEDWIDFAHPARALLRARGGSVALGTRLPNPALIHAYATSAGEAATGRASDGCAVDIGLLRAGDVVVIEDLRIEPGHGAGAPLIGAVWCAGAQEPIDIPPQR